MDWYLFNKLAGMHLIYCCANENGWRASCLYREIFPHWCHPHHKTSAATDHWLRLEHLPLAVNWGQERSIWIPDVEEYVLDHVGENPGVSMRQVETAKYCTNYHLEINAWADAVPIPFMASSGSQACWLFSMTNFVPVICLTMCEPLFLLSVPPPRWGRFW